MPFLRYLSFQPVTTKVRVQSQASLRGICGGQTVNGTCFYPGTSVFPYQFHSTSGPILVLDWRYCVKKSILFTLLYTAHCNITITDRPDWIPSLKCNFTKGLLHVSSHEGPSSGSHLYNTSIVVEVVGWSKSFRPDIQKPRQMENAVRDM